jgi:hypothetical protein
VTGFIAGKVALGALQYGWLDPHHVCLAAQRVHDGAHGLHGDWPDHRRHRPVAHRDRRGVAAVAYLVYANWDRIRPRSPQAGNG